MDKFFLLHIRKISLQIYQIYQKLTASSMRGTKTSEWTKLMITCRNISYKNVKAKYRVKFQSTQVWKDILKSVRQIVESQVLTLGRWEDDRKIGVHSQPGPKNHFLWQNILTLAFICLFYLQPTMRWWVNWRFSESFTIGNKKVAVRQGYTGPWCVPIIENCLG